MYVAAVGWLLCHFSLSLSLALVCFSINTSLLLLLLVIIYLSWESYGQIEGITHTQTQRETISIEVQQHFPHYLIDECRCYKCVWATLLSLNNSPLLSAMRTYKFILWYSHSLGYNSTFIIIHYIFIQHWKICGEISQ